MAQVTSTPGQNQAFGNVAVAVGPVQPGASQSRGASTATIVSYGQVEAGVPGDNGQHPKRS